MEETEEEGEHWMKKGRIAGISQWVSRSSLSQGCPAPSPWARFSSIASKCLEHGEPCGPDNVHANLPGQRWCWSPILMLRGLIQVHGDGAGT